MDWAILTSSAILFHFQIWSCNLNKPFLIEINHAPLEMTVSLDDEDFKEWLGKTIGVICQETVDLSGDVGDSMKNVMSAIGAGVKGKTQLEIE